MDEPSPGERADSAIVQRVLGGDVQAYGTLVDRYERVLLAAVLPVVKDLHAAQDVVQDVFVQCFQKIGTLRDGSRFGGWLLTVGGREAVRAARRRRGAKLRLAADTLAPELGVPSNSIYEPILNDEREWILSRVRGLPEHERIAVSLRYFEGRGVHEIAQIIGRPVGTITKQLSRAIERLRGELGASVPTPSQEDVPCQTHQLRTD